MTSDLLYIDHSQCEYAKRRLSFLADTVRLKLFPPFENITGDAREAANQWQSEAMRGPGEDSEWVYEGAYDYEINFGLELQQVADTVLGYAVAMLYHQFEKLVVDFLKREVSRTNATPDIRSWDAIRKLFRQYGVDLERLPCHPDLNELRLVANAVKHGEGSAFEDLKKANSSVLRPPPKGSKRLIGEFLQPSPFSHLGIELYLTLDDFDRYVAATLDFWNHERWKSMGESFRRIP